MDFPMLVVLASGIILSLWGLGGAVALCRDWREAGGGGTRKPSYDWTETSKLVLALFGIVVLTVALAYGFVLVETVLLNIATNPSP